MPTLDRITIYPIKSLDGQTVDQAHVLRSGALEFDRRWAIVDSAGKFVNAKRTALLHRIRSRLELANLRLYVEDETEVAEFDLLADREELEHWLSERLAARVRLVENPSVGFPDDTDACGPTIVSTATLESVATWFPGLTLDEVRRRFRANLEIGGVEAFWEDRLYGSPGKQVRFAVGDVSLLGFNPCQRCVVPTRSPQSGVVWPEFAKTFGRLREQSLPAWATRERFNHFYRLTTNTGPPAGFTGGVIRLGGGVAIT